MLFLVDEKTRKASPVESTSFASLQVKERHDLQEWILATPELLGEPLFIVTSEFDHGD